MTLSCDVSVLMLSYDVSVLVLSCDVSVLMLSFTPELFELTFLELNWQRGEFWYSELLNWDIVSAFLEAFDIYKTIVL